MTTLKSKINSYQRRFPQVTKLTISDSTAVNKRFTAKFVMNNKQHLNSRLLAVSVLSLQKWQDGRMI